MAHLMPSSVGRAIRAISKDGNVSVREASPASLGRWPTPGGGVPATNDTSVRPRSKDLDRNFTHFPFMEYATCTWAR
jgi:hypothetical protein